MPRSALRTLCLAVAVGPVLGAFGCAHHVESRAAREAPGLTGLSYSMQIDTTRLRRVTGLPPVASVANLVEENLIRFFRVKPSDAPASAERREILAEAVAPGYVVRVIIEPRPDDYCLVAIEAFRRTEEGGPLQPAPMAPYSVHHGVSSVRSALASLRVVSRPVLAAERFDLLRKQAAALAAQGQDPAIDDATFARTPRPLERPDEPPRYYAPTDNASTVRPE